MFHMDGGEQMADTLLRLQAVMDRTGIKRSKVYDLVAKGEFPNPVKVGACVLWPESKVSAWIAERIAASEADAR